MPAVDADRASGAWTTRIRESSRGQVRARRLDDRHWLTRHHRLVHGALALGELSVDGNLFSRANAQHVADLDGVQLHRFIRAAGIHPHGRLGCEVEQGPYGPGRLLTGAQFKYLAQQHQHGYDRRRLEENRDRAIFHAQFGGEQPRCQGADNAVEPCRASAKCNQGKHVEAAILQGCPAPMKKWPTGPPHHRGGQQQLHPVRCLRCDDAMQIDQMAAHFQRKYRGGERKCHPEATRHVAQFGAVLRLRGGDDRFQRHATDGAIAWAHLAHLSMHRAGVHFHYFHFHLLLFSFG